MPTIFCPTCESMLEVDSSSIGAMVECGSCKAQFTAKLPKEATKSKREDDDNDDTWKSKRPSRRSRYDDDDEERSDDPLDESYQSNVKPGGGLALTSLILGIIGVVTSFASCLHPCCGGAFVVLDILAIVFGAITLKSEHHSKAFPGLMLGIAGIVLRVICTVLFVVFHLAIR